MIKLSLDFPLKFFEEEYRSGYLVSVKMKEIWAVELDLLYRFQTVCSKYNLKYFAESGTLLGAVRHGGFIPWDDDIDVVMLRSDYQKLCEIAKKEFDEPYFFQTESTNPGTARGHAQLRNSKTTGILESEKGEKYCFNQGIFIDIFPMDAVPPVSEQESFFEKLDYLKNKSREFANKYHRRGIYVEENPYFQELELLSQRYNEMDMPKIGTLEYSGRRRDMMRKKADYLETMELKFEFLTVAVPRGYKRVLSEQYGNWKEFVIGKTSHGGILFDTEKSYREYIGGELDEMFSMGDRNICRNIL